MLANICFAWNIYRKINKCVLVRTKSHLFLRDRNPLARTNFAL